MTYQLWNPLSLVSYGMCTEALSLGSLRSKRHTNFSPVLSTEVTFTYRKHLHSALHTLREIHPYPLLFICLFTLTYTVCICSHLLRYVLLWIKRVVASIKNNGNDKLPFGYSVISLIFWWFWRQMCKKTCTGFPWNWPRCSTNHWSPASFIQSFSRTAELGSPRLWAECGYRWRLMFRLTSR
jgi:hypothetical protein